MIKFALTIVVLFLAYVIYLDALVTKQFEGRKRAPAKVFARPVELYPGQRIAPDDLQSQLKRQGYQPVRNVIRPGTFSRENNQFEIYGRGFYFPDGYEPPRHVNIVFQDNRVTQVTSKNHKQIDRLKLDPQPIGGIYPASYEDRLLIKASQTPPYLIPALLAIEDKGFYDHIGISFSAIARAITVNLKAGSVVQGGSTITQQLVKNFFLSNQRTVTRKAKEAIMALLLEYHYDKEEILETYLNEVYLGQQGRRAIHGIGLASQFYFAQPLQELNLAKTALLVALIKGPSYFDPRRYPERAIERRNLVLDILADQNNVSVKEIERSKNLSLGVVSNELMSTNDFPAYIDIVKEQLRKNYSEKDLTNKGLRVFTNLDPVIQREAQKSVTNTLKKVGKNNRLQGAMVVSSAQTGDLLAVVGGRDPGYAGFNRALEARRPVGSLLKPAIYLTALEQPNRYTLITPVNDVPVSIKNGHGELWQPHNYSHQTHGQIPLYQALANSYNLAAVNIGMEVGLPSVLNTLKRLGIEQKIQPYPSVLLGSPSMTPIEVTGMFQTIASGGLRMPLRAIDTVVDNQGRPLIRYNTSVQRTFQKGPMELLRTALVMVMEQGTGRRIYQYIKPGIKLGGKTGTSNELRDSWFAGYTNNLVGVTWIGYDDNSPTTLTGNSGALKIWGSFLSSIPVHSVASLNTDNVTNLWVNPIAGKQSQFNCEGALLLPFINGSEPKDFLDCHSYTKKLLFNKIKGWSH